MLINTFDCGPRNTKILEEAAEFFAAQLLHPRTAKCIELDLEIVDKLDVQGECISEDDCKNPRFFTIRLRKQKLDEMIKTLGHEMVHVKQYAKNELSKQMRMTRRGLGIGSKWHGEWWDPKGKEDDYWDSPWEIEAYGREVGLHHKWVAHKGK